ncbi:START-like domain-containing protein [Marinilabilia sp.]|uniref:START-like domain-containing protein n=1 Tax=Marinilabilia sp. TaxID=2021252 RepID=UPI0025BF5791|nr:START-like domain-containing protein [Marinilabilia sp.]
MADNLEKIELEYMLNTSPAILFNRLATPSGLSEWFADNVNVKGKVFTFIWEGSEQKAEQTLRKENKMVRYQWLDEGMEGIWFEFEINVDELTGDVALIITDNVEPEDKNDTTELWDQQVDVLKHGLGSS